MTTKTKDYYRFGDDEIDAELEKRLGHLWSATGRIEEAILLAYHAGSHRLILTNRVMPIANDIWFAAFVPDEAPTGDFGLGHLDLDPARAVCIAWLKWHDKHGGDVS